MSHYFYIGPIVVAFDMSRFWFGVGFFGAFRGLDVWFGPLSLYIGLP